MRAFVLIYLASLVSIALADPSLWDRTEDKKGIVYTGPKQLSNNRRRVEAMARDGAASLLSGALMATNVVSMPQAGAAGAVNSARKAKKAARNGQVFKAVGHGLSAAAKPLVGVVGGAASLVASPLPLVAGAGSAAYNTAMMGVDKVRKTVSRRTKDEEQARETKNVEKVVRHAQKAANVQTKSLSAFRQVNFKLAGIKETEEGKQKVHELAHVYRSPSSKSFREAFPKKEDAKTAAKGL